MPNSYPSKPSIDAFDETPDILKASFLPIVLPYVSFIAEKSNSYSSPIADGVFKATCGFAFHGEILAKFPVKPSADSTPHVRV